MGWGDHSDGHDRSFRQTVNWLALKNRGPHHCNHAIWPPGHFMGSGDPSEVMTIRSGKLRPSRIGDVFGTQPIRTGIGFVWENGREPHWLRLGKRSTAGSATFSELNPSELVLASFGETTLHRPHWLRSGRRFGGSRLLVRIVRELGTQWSVRNDRSRSRLRSGNRKGVISSPSRSRRERACRTSPPRARELP
jgi:hypothetical protein